MPTRKALWSSWNYIGRNAASGPLTVSYWMNALQTLEMKRDVFVTLNPPAGGEVRERGDLRDAFQDLVLGPGSISGQYIDKGAIARIAEDHAAGRENKDKTLWTLYSLEIFLREHF